jgi:transposase
LSPKKQRRTDKKSYEELLHEGYQGAYDSVRRFVQTWKESQRISNVQAYIPLEFEPGEAFQFDWRHEDVEIAGLPQRVKAAQFTLYYSRMCFPVVYPRETLDRLTQIDYDLGVSLGGLSC